MSTKNWNTGNEIGIIVIINIIVIITLLVLFLMSLAYFHKDVGALCSVSGR